MSRRSQEASSHTASDNAKQRSAKPNVFKSLDWRKELGRVLKKNAVRIPAAMTRQEIRRCFGDEADCEMLTPETIPLKCPYTAKQGLQQANPSGGEGVNCQRLRCFDLSAFIQVRVCSNRWYCPLCGTETKLDLLRINEFVNGILHATDASVERVELLGDGSVRPVAQVEIDPDVKINDELPYVPAPEDVKPNVAEGGQGLLEAMDVEQERLSGSAMTADSELEDASFLEDVKPPMPLQPDQLASIEPEVLSYLEMGCNKLLKVITSDEAEDSFIEDVKPVIARGETSSTFEASEQRTDLEDDDSLELQLETSNAEVQRVTELLYTEQAIRLDLELKVWQMREDLDDAKARFGELQQKRAQEDHEKELEDNAEGELKQLKEDIAKKQEELQDLTPQYQELLKKEEQPARDVRVAEQKVKELHAKQGQRDQFRTAEERDTHLKKQIYHLNRQVDDVESQVHQIEESIAKEKHDLNGALRKLETYEDQASPEFFYSSRAKFFKQKLDLDQAVTAQTNANREEKQLREQLLGLQQDYANTKSDLRRITSKADISKAAEKSAACATNVEKLRREIQNTVRELYANLKVHKQIAKKRRTISELVNRRRVQRWPKKAQLAHLRSRVRELKAYRAMYEEQLGTDFRSQLSASEHNRIELLQAHINAKRAQLDDVSRQRSTVENKKRRLENQLQSYPVEA
ncbi:SMC protein Flexible Hinge Domain containing protein [Aphelenchoides avenae]|nr:SMC protein Flexible Hinge Domain containing protein [Aphelenchus avenae]